MAKYTAHLIISKGYTRALACDQSITELQEQCDDYNIDEGGPNWRNEPLDRVVVTVEFEVDDSVFEPKPIPQIAGKIPTE